MLKDLFRTIRAVVIVFGVLLTFFAVLEVIRSFQTLYSLHPAAGYVFLAVLLGGGVWLGVWFICTIGKSPKVLTPPVVDDADKMDIKHLRRWTTYQMQFLCRLGENPLIDDACRQNITAGLERLRSVTGGSYQPLHDAVLAVEQNTITPALELLDKQASKQIRDCVRDVMLGVTLSPYKSVDLFIVLYRNVMMTGRIIRIYNSRPTLGHSLRLGLDILNIVATVNYINMGKSLIEALASRLPGIGKLTDDIAQGIGAGFMTSIAGHAAMDRCRAFHSWDPQEARAGLLDHIGGFYADVRDIFFADVWGFVKVHSGQATDQVRDLARQAIDQTAQTITEYVRIPAKAAVATGQTIVQGTAWGTKTIRDILRKPFEKDNGGKSS